MAKFSKDTKLSELLADKRYMKVVDKYVAGASTNPGVVMVKNLSLEQLIAIPQVHSDEASMNKLIDELNETFG
ncbi:MULTISPECIES: hypothetical protein [Lacticaseibacillus]|jgi:hypothetical protein|uniref:Uncharacterized protein n=7 Tax=Lacticaseibacillus TaxID=2759736 RepID=A0AAN1F0T9_LACCA|nr:MULTISPECIES: hypothetical protein [Lacticaseibacillus]OFR97022.1 hypothetical protein HMPREF2861_07565 [Lactobacillus sp. HMSC068F07]ARY92654.1 hypothetical protein BGL52_13160 [Lacticaseibacillus casei]KAB1969505.1 hypothetical protein F9B82_08130 [Lacticaseibacillus casei]KLI75690.1 hypothetical protein AAW28_09355 [Lacticaseibacillus casei]KRK11645.1 hypothetical protein FD51_GL001079 [Lacticaseibacillus zeae DSM 20178 = KCTC 3804]